MIADSAFFPSDDLAKHRAADLALVWEQGASDIFSAVPSQLTWAAFHQLLRQTAQWLAQQGVAAQHSVAYCGSHRLGGLLIYCAVLASGGRILMLNPAQTVSQRQAVLADCGVDFLVDEAEFAKNLPKTTACKSLSALDFNQAATFTLTSGSNGRPKAAVHSIAAHLANAEGVCELMRFERHHSWLLSLPLFHVSGQGIVWRWLFKGARLYINENKTTFSDSLQNVTHCSLVPTQLNRFLSLVTPPVSLNCLLGGTFISPDLVNAARQCGVKVFSGYGMTEAASTVCAVENETDNVGRPLKHRQLRIENGEIWLKGNTLAMGYLQKNGEIRPLVNEQGWFQTKDGGHWNARGQLVVGGRLDNMFISGGENIQPEEIERLIYQFATVVQAFVLPLADAEFGRRPVAVVQFAEGKNFVEEADKLKIWLSDKLEKFKQPTAYFRLAVEKYQKQGTIKISRTQLQQDLNERIKGHYA